MTNPTRILERFYASLSYVGLAGVVSFIGLMLATPVMIRFSHSELEIAVSSLAVTTANLFAIYTLVALWRSSDEQVVLFSRDNTRKFMAFLATLGVYLCEVLLWFVVSDLAKPFWQRSSGGVWFIAFLFLGSVCGMLGLAGRYHQLVWPRKPSRSG